MKFMFVPLEVRSGSGNTDFPIDLLGLVIHYARTIIHTAKAGILSCVKKNGLNEGGFPFAAMAEGSYVSNVTRFNLFHFFSFLLPYQFCSQKLILNYFFLK